jgi:hypothetical protein
MAIKYKDIRNKLETDPLTDQELSWIKQAEDYIDDEILTKFGKYYYEVGIDKAIVNFNWSPATKKPIDTMSPRRAIMQRVLEKKYVNAGWALNWGDIDDHYVIFKGK